MLNMEDKTFSIFPPDICDSVHEWTSIFHDNKEEM